MLKDKEKCPGEKKCPNGCPCPKFDENVFPPEDEYNCEEMGLDQLPNKMRKYKKKGIKNDMRIMQNLQPDRYKYHIIK